MYIYTLLIRMRYRKIVRRGEKRFHQDRERHAKVKMTRRAIESRRFCNRSRRIGDEIANKVARDMRVTRAESDSREEKQIFNPLDIMHLSVRTVNTTNTRREVRDS